MFNKVYGTVSIFFVIMIFSQTFVVQHLTNPILLKAFDYGFWYALGAFSALFVVRRVTFSKQHYSDEKNVDLSN